MFDIGWSEFLLVAVICLFAFGPEDIPKLMYNFGRIVRRFRYMRYALSSQFEDFMEKAEAGSKKGPLPDGAPVKALAAGMAAKSATRDIHPNDETDADEYLLDLMPLPEHDVPEIPVTLPDEPDERPAPAADRG